MRSLLHKNTQCNTSGTFLCWIHGHIVHYTCTCILRVYVRYTCTCTHIYYMYIQHSKIIRLPCFFAVCTTGIAFTCSNVLRAVRTVENWWGEYGLGHRLYISEEKRKEIQLVYSDPEEQRRQLILYWMSTDPLASWRRLITRLDWMSQSPVADGIRDFVEPLAAGAV